MRHAIIGCGQVAPNHVDAFRCVEGVEVVSACDRDLGRADSLASEHAIPATTCDHRDVLEDPTVDSVSIAVDHAEHAELTGAALHAGKHVLLEKPIALDVEQGRALCREADESGLVLAVVAQHRYDPIVRELGAWITEGLLGRVVMASTQIECSRDRQYYEASYWRGTWSGEGGSVLINQAYHCVDILTALCGPFCHATSMMATLRAGDVIDTEDTFAAALESTSGALVTVSATTAGHSYWDARISVVGTNGSIAVALNHPVRLMNWEGSPVLCDRVQALLEAIRSEAPTVADPYGISHRRQVVDFCRAVRTRQPLVVPPGDSVATLDTVCMLYRAAGRVTSGGSDDRVDHDGMRAGIGA